MRRTSVPFLLGLAGAVLLAASPLYAPIASYIRATTTCTQTVEGEVCWDADDDALTVGTGAGRRTMLDTTGAVSGYIADPAGANGDLLWRTGGVWASDTPTVAGVQPLDANELSSIAGLTSAADRLPYYMGSGTAALATYTSTARSIDDDASIAAVQTTLGGGLGRVPVVHVAAGAPTTGDDSGDGYAVGDLWQDTSGNVTYQLDDATVGAADWRSLLSGGARRAVAISVVSGVLSWAEQTETASGWSTVTSWTALSTDTDGGVTFSGSNATLPSGWTTGTGCASQPDERYMLVSSLSATMQALLASGALITLQASETAMGTTADSRWGIAMAVTGGASLDATSECIAGMRAGYTGSAWSLAAQGATGAYGALTTAATMEQRRLALIGATATVGLWAWDVGASLSGGATGGTTKASLPDRIYWTAGAAGTVSGTTLVTAPVARVIAEVP